MQILDSTTSRLCLDTHPVAVAFMLIQYAKDWESTLQFLSTVALLQGVEFNDTEIRRLIQETYKG